MGDIFKAESLDFRVSIVAADSCHKSWYGTRRFFAVRNKGFWQFWLALNLDCQEPQPTAKAHCQDGDVRLTIVFQSEMVPPQASAVDALSRLS
jgi:hypothetical protein